MLSPHQSPNQAGRRTRLRTWPRQRLVWSFAIGNSMGMLCKAKSQYNLLHTCLASRSYNFAAGMSRKHSECIRSLAHKSHSLAKSSQNSCQSQFLFDTHTRLAMLRHVCRWCRGLSCKAHSRQLASPLNPCLSIHWVRKTMYFQGTACSCGSHNQHNTPSSLLVSWGATRMLPHIRMKFCPWIRCWW